jgi:hypothetical protein
MYPNSLVLEACSCFTPVTTQFTTQTATITAAIRELLVPTTTNSSWITTTIATSTITSTLDPLSEFSRVYGPSSCSPIPNVASAGLETAFPATTFFNTPYPSGLSLRAIKRRDGVVGKVNPPADNPSGLTLAPSTSVTCDIRAHLLVLGFLSFSPLMNSFLFSYGEASPGPVCTYTEA